MAAGDEVLVCQRDQESIEWPRDDQKKRASGRLVRSTAANSDIPSDVDYY
jgi:hypothetical protein